MKRRGLIIGGYDTARKGYTMTSCSLENPKIVENYVEVPGAHGALDFCDAMTGSPVYQTRKLKATFELSVGTFAEREKEFARLIHAVHGRRCSIIHPDYPGKTLTGRVLISVDAHTPSYGTVTMEAKCDPWLCEDAYQAATIPLLPASYNLATYDSLEVMDSLGTCSGAKVAQTQHHAPGISALSGDPKTYAVFRLKLEAGKSYYLSGSINSTGYWRVGTTAELPEEFTPIVTTGDDGYLYIFVIRAKKYGGYAILSQLVCIDASYAISIRNGYFPSTATHTSSEKVSSLTLINGVSHFNEYFTAEATLEAGESIVASICLGSTEADDLTTTLQWKRRWLR